MTTDDFPKTVLEFEERFSTEAACIEYVRNKKWPLGFKCSRCSSLESWKLLKRDECRRCGHQESVTAGTLFHQTRKPLRLWFRAIALWVTSKRGISAKELSRQLGIHYETAWHWCHRLRDTVAFAFGTTPLTGAVELSQTLVGGTRDRAQKGPSLATKRARIAAAVEVRASGKMGRARLAQLPGHHAETFDVFAQQTVSTMARVHGEDISECLAIPAHCTTRKTRIRQVTKRRGTRTLLLFSLFNRVLLGTFQGSVSHKHLHAYLAEFQFRFNRRNSGSRWLLFERMLGAAPLRKGLTLKQLT
jgi:hypothetical protein